MSLPTPDDHEAVIGLGAIQGGIALLQGAFDQVLPVAWLAGTPFSDYTIPVWCW